MSEHDESQRDEADQFDDEGPRNPFDNPYFMPVALFAFALWFGYDGWFNPAIESVMFNRVGFPVILILALYFAWRARLEIRAEREKHASEGSERNGGDHS